MTEWKHTRAEFTGKTIKHVVLGMDNSGYPYVEIATTDGHTLHVFEYSQTGEFAIKHTDTTEERLLDYCDNHSDDN